MRKFKIGDIIIHSNNSIYSDQYMAKEIIIGFDDYEQKYITKYYYDNGNFSASSGVLYQFAKLIVSGAVRKTEIYKALEECDV